MIPTVYQLITPGWPASYFASFLALALTLYHRSHPDHASVFIDTLQPEAEYDFIVVGAGSAGAVVANRLSENQNWKVLVLEAGGPPTEISNVPAQLGTLVNSELDWKYRTEPPKKGQAYCLAMNGYECFMPAGKVVGGSSSTGGMIYMRGNKHDYDDWESLGNEGWGYNNVLKYFLKSEDNANARYLQTPYHSSKGYLSVEDVRYTTPLAHTFVEAGKHLGYENRDVNGKDQEGFMIVQMMTQEGSRHSTSKAFIEPAQKRPNLDLSMYSFVTRIGFEAGDFGPVARTVSYMKDNKQYTVRARKEIILTTGTVKSPQLLMLSGIGPKEHLKELGIEVVKDLPVGYNLQDHISAGELTFTVDRNVTLKPNPENDEDAVRDYLERGRGPLTTTNAEATAFVNSKYANPLRSHPDVQLFFVSGSMYNSPPFGTARLNIRPDLFVGTEYEHLDKDGNYFFIVAFLLRPKSKGRVLLRSKNPYDKPIIEPNYFAKREDVKVLVDAYQMALKLVNTPPFEEYNAAPIKIPFPGCERFKLFCEEYFECQMRQFSGTNYHLTSTCPMGTGADAVVDPRLRVIGVKGLRVIDASIMPNIVSGNLPAPTIMIAEKGSDMIKEDWNSFGQEWQNFDPRKAFWWPAWK